ncbi:hypothetical protein ACI7BZ_08275 [Xanthobacter sp. AM11]|uniref:hypothetical protein n=1 Tax=Xanthobacter sp. AM11 TaxID=3380643 RepID=UPI0039BF81F2
MSAQDILKIVAAWALPLLLAWLAANRDFVTRRPQLLAAIVAAAVSVATIITAVQLFNPLRGTIVLAREVGPCPSGYSDEDRIILIRWRNAPSFFQVAGDIPTRGNYAGNPDWVNDHARLCVHP